MAEHLKNKINIKRVLYYQDLPYISEIIWTEFINRYYDNILVNFFDINKT